MAGERHAALPPLGALRQPRGVPKRSSSERRDRVRCQVRIDIDVQSERGVHGGVTRDLSETGAFVVTDLERPVGTRLELRLHLPSAEAPLACAAEVRWSRAKSGSDDEPRGLGLRLLGLEEEPRRRLQAFLATLEPCDCDD